MACVDGLRTHLDPRDGRPRPPASCVKNWQTSCASKKASTSSQVDRSSEQTLFASWALDIDKVVVERRMKVESPERFTSRVDR